jgi:hypothetical protein
LNLKEATAEDRDMRILVGIGLMLVFVGEAVLLLLTVAPGPALGHSMTITSIGFQIPGLLGYASVVVRRFS